MLLLSIMTIDALATVVHYDYRRFWDPLYHSQRLAYCDMTATKCGMSVATHYCESMGYTRADQVDIAYNVGLAHYFNTKLLCKGWTCNGFKFIRCMRAHPQRQHGDCHHKIFVLPRYNHYRIAWCNHKYCGKKVANSFCRRMGYMRASAYTSAHDVYATRNIGDQRLCFGKQCKGFAQITCYR